MTSFTVGPEEGKVYASKKDYPCKADKSIDGVTSKVCAYVQHWKFTKDFVRPNRISILENPWYLVHLISASQKRHISEVMHSCSGT